jgi:hypothetical protein
MDGNGGDNIRALLQNMLQFLPLALWGGLASYLTKIAKEKRSFSFGEMIGEMVVSGFAGLVAMYCCMYFEFGMAITAVYTGIAGHMGGRAITYIEGWLVDKADRALDNKSDPR